MHPMGWVGSNDQFFAAIDVMIDLKPDVIVPGHGPVCRIEALHAERDYFPEVYDQSKVFFDQGVTAREAAARNDLGGYRHWKAPARLVLNVERAHREFRDEAPSAPWDTPAIFDSIYEVANTPGCRSSTDPDSPAPVSAPARSQSCRGRSRHWHRSSAADDVPALLPVVFFDHGGACPG
jgi:hypothetical protein